MSDAIWALIGVVAGAAISAVAGWLQQGRRFRHDEKMYSLGNRGPDTVKAFLTEMLSHKKFTDRSFEALSSAIGGYTDDQIRQFLHEIGAKKATRDNGMKEWWYLVSRSDERIAKRAALQLKSLDRSGERQTTLL